MIHLSTVRSLQPPTNLITHVKAMYKTLHGEASITFSTITARQGKDTASRRRSSAAGCRCSKESGAEEWHLTTHRAGYERTLPHTGFKPHFRGHWCTADSVFHTFLNYVFKSFSNCTVCPPLSTQLCRFTKRLKDIRTSQSLKMKPFNWRYMACPCGQIQILVNVVSNVFLCTLSDHGEVQMWTVTLVFQQISALMVPRLFLNIQISFLFFKLKLVQSILQQKIYLNAWIYLNLYVQCYVPLISCY